MVFVKASTLGLNLIPTLVHFFLFLDIFSINFISFSDSALIRKIFLSIAKLISSDVFPTPEKTILLGEIPAFRDVISSPFETTSAPKLFFFKIFKISKLLFAFIEKQISGFIDLKFFLKISIFLFRNPFE